MKKKISLGAAITFMLITAAVTFSLTTIFSLQSFNSKVNDIKEREAIYSKLAEIDRMVRKNYIGSIDEDVLMDAVAAGYVKGTGDVYAQYLNLEAFESYMEGYEGSMVGIGVGIERDTSGYLHIADVYDNSPAQEAGLQAGDLIVKVDDLAITEKNSDQALKAIRGETGTVVRLMIRRGVEETEYEVTRKKIDLPVISHRMIDRIGYIRIQDFTEAATSQFQMALIDLQSQGAEGLVFDLRGNTGGSVPALCKMLDLLCPSGVLVSAEYSDGTTEVLGSSDSSEITLPMVTLTNKGTASSSELFVQVLKDYGKAESVGETTYGKGVMQTIIKLSDGSALNLTNAKTLPPRSPNFDGIGVKPDYEVKLTAEQQESFESLDEYTDPQLQKAISVLQSSIEE